MREIDGFLYHDAQVKIQGVRKVKPRTIILGTSRAHWSIDPDHDGFRYRPVYNLALGGSRPDETLAYLKFAYSVNPLKQVLMFVDFFVFEKNWAGRGDFIEDTFNHNYCDLPTWDIKENGMGIWEDVGSCKVQFKKRKRVMKEMWQKYELRDMGCYYEAIDFCHDNYIDLIISTSPCHVVVWKTIDECGIRPQYEEWKRLLENDKFPVHNLSVENKYTKEKVTKKMRWYYDPFHYTKELGDITLDILLKEMLDE